MSAVWTKGLPLDSLMADILSAVVQNFLVNTETATEKPRTKPLSKIFKL